MEEPREGEGCVLCSRVSLRCTLKIAGAVPGLRRLVEGQIEKTMVASHRTLPERIRNYLKFKQQELLKASPEAPEGRGGEPQRLPHY